MSGAGEESRPTSAQTINNMMEKTMNEVRDKYSAPNLWVKLKMGESEVYWPQLRSVLESIKDMSDLSIQEMATSFSELEEGDMVRFLQCVIRLRRSDKLVQPLDELVVMLGGVPDPEIKLQELSLPVPTEDRTADPDETFPQRNN